MSENLALCFQNFLRVDGLCNPKVKQLWVKGDGKMREEKVELLFLQ